MCGIVGFIGENQAEWIEKMNGALHHRGPDQGGIYSDPQSNTALGMRRLSILDVTGGRQPMQTKEGDLCIVFNGEIFNSPELRKTLQADGVQFFTSNSDTEVLLHLYRKKQESMLQDLNGMFSFVIYDRKRKVLFGARDRFGIKPFYYVHAPHFFSFASEIKSFLPMSWFERDVDSQSLYHYMSLGFVPGKNTIYKMVKRLEPGHSFHYDISSNQFKTARYWSLKPKQSYLRTEKEASEFVRDELGKAVQRWSLSDVPVGCSLSGGLDSSAIVALLSKQGSSKVQTYSLGFTEEDGADLNELSLAKQVANQYGTDHHELTLKPETLLRALGSMVWHLDEPYGGGLPSWMVFQFMAKDVKVGMTGTGGDELFGDYHKDRNLNPQGPLAMFKKMFSSDPHDKKAFRQGYFDRFYYLSDEAKSNSVFHENLNAMEDTSEYLRSLYSKDPALDAHNQVAVIDMRSQLPEEFLFMTDRFSMAHSLEARVPFLDHEFAEMMVAIPSALRSSPSNYKSLLKKALTPLLPKDVLHGEKKGFVLPTAKWLRGPLKKLSESLLSTDRLKKQGLFQPEWASRLLQEHMEGQQDHHKVLWFLLMFQVWHSIFIEQKAVEKPTWSFES